jgi:hypothetical protein
LCAATDFCPLASAKNNNLRPDIESLQDEPVPPPPPGGGMPVAPFLVQKVPLGTPVSMGNTVGSVRISSPGRLDLSYTAAEAAAVSLLILTLALALLFGVSMLIIAAVRVKAKKQPVQPFDYFSLSYTTPYNLPVTNIKKQKGFTASGMGIVLCIGLAAAVVANAVLSIGQERIDVVPYGVSPEFELSTSTDVSLDVRFYGTRGPCQGNLNQSSCADAVALGVDGFNKPGLFTCKLVQGEWCMVTPPPPPSRGGASGSVRTTAGGCRSRGTVPAAVCSRPTSRQARTRRSSPRPSPSS